MAKTRSTSTTVRAQRTKPVAPAGNLSDTEYAKFLEHLNARFPADQPLFTTDASGLFEAYLAAMPKKERQFHNCNACRKFIEQFGGLVTIADDGRSEVAVWGHLNEIPPIYRKSITAMWNIVSKAKVTGVFLSSEKKLGMPKTGAWRHLSLINDQIFQASVVRSAYQAIAEKQTEFETVSRAIKEFSLEALHQVCALLQADVLYRSEKVLGQAVWLRDLSQAVSATPKHRHSNVIRRAVANAPAGFCHPRSSMIGTLLDDLASGMSFVAAAQRFREKMSPTWYQRPQAAPKQGNIVAASHKFEALGLEPALARRYARLEEVLPYAIWFTPAPGRPKVVAGPFAHLLVTPQRPRMEATTPQHITWRKFAQTVLPAALRLELYLDRAPGQPFCGIVTATDPQAPSLFQWGHAFSWYFHVNGDTPGIWSLPSSVWVDIPAVVPKPSSWSGHYPQHGDGALFVIPGARDTMGSSLCLFPEILKAEFHDIRATIEAHSNSGQITGRASGNANGYMFYPGVKGQPSLRVTLPGNLRVTYIIDRWD